MALNRVPQAMKMISQPTVCPTCGGLEGFERTRYFCGQLLTDKDLDASQRYVIEKNKLHNRYLVGTGVVCGLAVRCHSSCNGMVEVESGYAIDCCGNDIVVCETAEFKVLEYLKANQPKLEPDCNDRIRPRPSTCDGGPKEYYLLISYNEVPSRPMTALVRGNGCTVNRCEPSRTIESYRFDLIEDHKIANAMLPSFWGKVQKKYKEMGDYATQFWQKHGSAEQAYNVSINKVDALRRYYDTMKDLYRNLLTFLSQVYREGPNVRCNLEEELRGIEQSFPPLPANPSEEQIENPRKDWQTVEDSLTKLWWNKAWTDYFCDALLVPCTDCNGQEGVLLACLTIKDDKIENICNTVRTQIITGPALQYWLEPLFTSMSNQLESLGCKPAAEKL